MPLFFCLFRFHRMLISEFLNSSCPDQPFVVVLGHPVAHSRSPLIHNAALRSLGISATYHAVDCPVDQRHLIPELLAEPQCRGANITIPLKHDIIRFLDDLAESAREIGAVNTIVPVHGNSSDGTEISGKPHRLIGHNTDAFGFIKPLEGVRGIAIVTVLGSGGASRAIRYALAKTGVKKIFLISRSAKGNQTDEPVEWMTYDNLEYAVRHSDLIVNATPAGMHPYTNDSPFPESLYPLLDDKICYDIIYNPMYTKFLSNAKQHGAKTIGGLDMFVYQASRSFELWFDQPMPVTRIRKLLQDHINTE